MIGFIESSGRLSGFVHRCSAWPQDLDESVTLHEKADLPVVHDVVGHLKVSSEDLSEVLLRARKLAVEVIVGEQLPQRLEHALIANVLVEDLKVFELQRLHRLRHGSHDTARNLFKVQRASVLSLLVLIERIEDVFEQVSVACPG